MCQVVRTNLSDPDGQAIFSGILTTNHDALAGAPLALVVDGIAYGADDVLYGEDGTWGKAGEIVLSSSLADGTHDTGSLADRFVALMTDRLPVVDHARLDRIRFEYIGRKYSHLLAED